MTDPTYWTSTQDAHRLRERLRSSKANRTYRYKYVVLSNGLTDRSCIEIFDSRRRHVGYIEQSDVEALDSRQALEPILEY